jgi:hypothetical protein
MQNGTGHDEFYRIENEYIMKSKLWGKFTTVASLGAINRLIIIYICL